MGSGGLPRKEEAMHTHWTGCPRRDVRGDQLRVDDLIVVHGKVWRIKSIDQRIHVQRYRGQARTSWGFFSDSTFEVIAH
jgi:hypothetical protein